MSTWPVELDAHVSIVHNALTITAYALTHQVEVPVEAAEWIWHEVLSGGDRRLSRALPGAKVRLFSNAVEITVGTYVVRRGISGKGAQRFVARKNNPELAANQEVVYR